MTSASKLTPRNVSLDGLQRLLDAGVPFDEAVFIAWRQAGSPVFTVRSTRG